jgi:hypothetical protein
MPAIIPARLKQQVALLADHFYDPPAFVRSMHHLMEAYSEGVIRAGQAGEPHPLIHSYHVRPQVIRRLGLELTPLAQEDLSAALGLCDALWAQEYLEFRLLAITLLGQLPVKPAQPIQARVRAWLEGRPGDRMIDLVFQQGMGRIRLENPKALLDLAEGWLQSVNIYDQRLGLRGLMPLAESLDFENVPLFYRLLQPFIRSAPGALRPDILDILSALARRSPQETALFLRETLAMPNTDTSWFIRHTLKDFPAETQDRLRQAMREAGRITTRVDEGNQPH